MVPSAQPPLATPPAPHGQAATFLEQSAGNEQSREQLVCKELLSPDQLGIARQYAAQLYPQMLDNTALFMSFGEDSVAGMNALIDRLLKEVKPVEIPELTAIMTDLTKDMRQIRGKYDISDPAVREKLEKLKNGTQRVFGIFGQTKTFLEMLMEDAQSIDQKLDRVKAALSEKSAQMLRNVLLYDEIYDANEAEISKVIGTIAIMELVRDLAAAEAASIQVTLGDPASRNAAERKRLLAEFIANLQVKIIEYKNRLYVGWTTSPQTTTMRTLDVAVAQKLHLLLNTTIPVMKGTLLQWRMMVQTQQAADMDRVVAESANEWLTAYSAAAAQVVPMIAEQAQTPSLTPQTIYAMANAIEQQADGIVKAYQAGREKRAQVDDAIVKGQRIIQAATEHVSGTVVTELVDEAVKPLPAEVTALPSGTPA
jgi:uncharacterized protein YaaN involved in tellurite resistance